MLAIEFRFLTGRFHATPWDHQVNEGVIEWPPSPWRVLRALMATWYLKAQEALPEESMRSLLLSLSSSLPVYHLPKGRLAHTRHYMPLGKIERGTLRTTKVFDTFIDIRQKPVVMAWTEVTLLPEQRAHLQTLLRRMGYLGRAESWVDARLLDKYSGTFNAKPFQEKDGSQELICLIAPLPQEAYTEWRESFLKEALQEALESKRARHSRSGKDPAQTTLSKTEQAHIETSFPAGLWAALQQENQYLRKQGWSLPPGAQWVDYVRPEDCFETDPWIDHKRKIENFPTVARYAIAAPTLPKLTHALSLTERIHMALVQLSNQDPLFTGCDAQKNPLKGHQHAYILPESNRPRGQRGQITHITIVAQGGFHHRAREVLFKLRRLWNTEPHETQMVLLGLGVAGDFAGLRDQVGQCPLLATSNVWVSRTPFVPTRHRKTNKRGEPKYDQNGRWIGSPEHDLARLLEEQLKERELNVTIEDIEVMTETPLGQQSARWLDFQTQRQTGKGKRSSDRGFGFKVTFSEPIAGPVVVGYGAHFGLGLFVPKT